jgi:hypothetical protein
MATPCHMPMFILQGIEVEKEEQELNVSIPVLFKDKLRSHVDGNFFF